MPSSSLTADAAIVYRGITADAWVMGERWRHHRVRDHYGAESDLYVVLSEDIGPYPMDTPIHWVISDLLARMAALEDSNQVRSSFAADAALILSGTSANGLNGWGHFTADSVILEAVTGSTTADAYLVRGGSFTADAILMPSFTANAFIVLL